MTAHPSPREFSALLQGTLPEEKSEALVEHLETCSPCQETVRNLESQGDTLMRSLRDRREPDPIDAACREVIRRASKLVPGAGRSDPSGDLPPSADSDSAGTHDADTPRPAGSVGAVGAASASAGPSPAEVKPAATVAQLLSQLKAAEIVTDDQWPVVEAEAKSAADGADLLRRLAGRGILTRFQAQTVSQGKARGLAFGDYVVLDRIGAGGMGQVYKARHRHMDRLVALKVMSQAAMKDADAVKRFQREVKAAARLSHPNIVAAYDAGRQGNVHYLVMEFVDGRDLSGQVKDHGPLPVREAIDAVLQAARGLAVAHAEGVVHRDIKPANLLRDKKGVVRVLDLGLARFEDPLGRGQDDGLTQSGAVMGTVDYMAPEQAFNTREAGPAADVYGLGCTLYRLLTGRPPYAGETVVQKILAHREQPIPALAGAVPGVAAALDGLFRRMLAKKPEDRPTMSEVAATLERIADSPDAPIEQALGESAPPMSALPATAGPPRAQPWSPPQPARPPQASSVPPTAAPLLPTAPSAPIRSGAMRNRSATSASGGRRPPRRRMLLAAAAGGLSIAALGVWIIVHRPDGQDTAVYFADATSVTVSPSPSPPAVPRVGSGPPSPSAGTATAPAAPTGGPTPAAAPAPTPGVDRSASATPGRVVNLLQLVDVKRDAVKGNWTLGPDGLVSDAAVPYGRIKLPYALPEEYDFRIEFTARGGNDILQILSARGRSFTLLMGGWGGKFDGFDAVAGHPFVREGTNIIGGPSLVRRDRRHVSVVKVRRDSIAAEIDGTLVARHATDFSDLSIPGEWSLDDEVLGLGTTYDGVTFHKVELVHPGDILDSTSLAGGAPPPAVRPTASPPADASTGYALRIDGTSDPIDLGDWKLHGPGPWTVEAWITPRAPLPSQGRNAIIFSVDPAWFSIRDASVGPKWSAGGPVFKPPPEQVSREKVQAGRPTHVALVRDAVGVSFYVDGQVQSDPLLIGAFNKQPRLRICQPPSARDTSFHGEIDELRVSSVARFPGPPPKRRFDADTDTTVLFHFEEGSGEMLNDASGNGRHGRIAGGVWVRADGGPIVKPATAP